MSKLIEKIFTVAMLFYTTGALLPYVTARLSGHFGVGSNGIELAIQTAFYGLAFGFIVLRWRGVARGAWNAKWILALVAVALASSAWSQDPMITLRRAVVLCATTAFGIYFATRFDVSEQLQLLAWTCGLVICASFLCAIFIPQFGIDQTVHYGDWQGAFHQKNMLARAMVLATIVFLFARFRWGNAFRWLGVAGSLTLLVLSHSVTGVILFAIILASWPIYRLFRTKFTFAVPVTAVALSILAAGAALAYQALPDMLELVNRDEGLTGRIDLWRAVWLSISRQPWLGYGFDAFWQGMYGESASVVQAVGWVPPHAHDGFLELLLELGIVGLVVFAVSYLLLWHRALQLVTRVGGNVPVWLCTYLFFLLVYNVTESAILEQNSIFWVLYTATAVTLSIDLPKKLGSERFFWNTSASQPDESRFQDQISCA